MFSALLECSFHGLWLENRFLLFFVVVFFFFLVYAYLFLQVASFLTSKSGIYETKKKTQGTHHCVDPQAPGSPASQTPFLHCSVFYV